MARGYRYDTGSGGVCDTTAGSYLLRYLVLRVGNKGCDCEINENIEDLIP